MKHWIGGDKHHTHTVLDLFQLGHIFTKVLLKEKSCVRVDRLGKQYPINQDVAKTQQSFEKCRFVRVVQTEIWVWIRYRMHQVPSSVVIL